MEDLPWVHMVLGKVGCKLERSVEEVGVGVKGELCLAAVLSWPAAPNTWAAGNLVHPFQQLLHIQRQSHKTLALSRLEPVEKEMAETVAHLAHSADVAMNTVSAGLPQLLLLLLATAAVSLIDGALDLSLTCAGRKKVLNLYELLGFLLEMVGCPCFP